MTFRVPLKQHESQEARGIHTCLQRAKDSIRNWQESFSRKRNPADMRCNKVPIKITNCLQKSLVACCGDLVR